MPSQAHNHWSTSDMWLAKKNSQSWWMCSLLIVKSVFLRLCMNEMSQMRFERDLRQILEIDAGECDYDGDGKLTLNFAYVQHWLVSWEINTPTTNHLSSPYVRHLICLAAIYQNIARRNYWEFKVWSLFHVSYCIVVSIIMSCWAHYNGSWMYPNFL